MQLRRPSLDRFAETAEGDDTGAFIWASRRHLLLLQPARCAELPSWQTKASRGSYVEHLRQRSRGGKDRAGNFAMACKRCNEQRGRTDCALFKSFRMGELEEYKAAHRPK